MINSLNNTKYYIRAKNIDEPFVKAYLEEQGCFVKPGTIDEDFSHIDLKIINGNKVVTIDVKRNSEEHKYSENFTLTVVSKTGKNFQFSKSGLFAFIDDIDKSIIFIEQEKVKKLILENNLEFHSSDYNKSKYVLLEKNKLIEIGKKKIPSRKVRYMLK